MGGRLASQKLTSLKGGAQRLTSAWFLRAVASTRAALGRPTSVRGYRDHVPGCHHTSAESLARSHFETRSDRNHINRSSMTCALSLLQGEPRTILETGMSAWGTDSSLLFADYVDQFGGAFFTVDVRVDPLLRLRNLVSERTVLTCDDSVRFLQRWVTDNSSAHVDLVYLDSMDVDWTSPWSAAVHGFREFSAVMPVLRNGAILLVDDTPKSPDFCPEPIREQVTESWQRDGVMPGKGMLVDLFLAHSTQASKVFHEYQAMWVFDP